MVLWHRKQARRLEAEAQKLDPILHHHVKEAASDTTVK